MPSTSSRRSLIAISVAVGSFSSLQSLLVPVLPTMQTDLSTDTAGITWALTAWLITAAVTTPIIGRIGDMVGKRRALIVCIAIVAVGCVVSAVAPNLAVLLIGRVLQGFGGAMFPLAFGLVREVVAAGRIAGAIGIVAAVTAVGSGIGTALSGPLATLIGWRGLFLVPLAGIVIGAVLVVTSIPESTVRAQGRLNVPAALLLSGALVSFLLPISLGSRWGWSSPLTLGMFGAAAILIAGWIVVELRSAQPLVDMRMMRLPGVWNANLAAVLVGGAMFGVWAYFARFLQEPTSTGYGLGLSVSQAGLVMVPMLVLMAAAGFLVAPISKVLSSRNQVIAGSVLGVGSTVSIALLHSNLWQLTIASSVFGFGVGLVLAAITGVLVQNVPLAQTGIATGMNTNFRTIGSALGTALMTAIVTGSVASSSPTARPTESGYTTGFLVLAAIGLAAAIVVAIARPTRKGPASAELAEEATA
jgi:MFS family permease